MDALQNGPGGRPAVGAAQGASGEAAESSAAVTAPLRELSAERNRGCCCPEPSFRGWGREAPRGEGASGAPTQPAGKRAHALIHAWGDRTPKEGQSSTPVPSQKETARPVQTQTRDATGPRAGCQPAHAERPLAGTGRRACLARCEARCEARCAARLPPRSRASLPAWLGTGRDTQLQALSLGAVAPSRSGAVILTGSCQRAPCVRACVSVQAGAHVSLEVAWPPTAAFSDTSTVPGFSL